jgi:hypothetical protein
MKKKKKKKKGKEKKMGEAIAYLTRGESMRLSFFCAFNLERNNAFFLVRASIVDNRKILGAFSGSEISSTFE